MLADVVVVVGAFVGMEPVTYATHRWVMHGPGAALHRSHHRRRRGTFEANDAYPLAFASVVLGGLWAGFHVEGWGALVPVGIGISAYGVAYATVHDLYVHQRLGRWGWRPAVLERLGQAHTLHHRRGGGEPYGMLLPITAATSRAPRRG